MRFWHIGHFFDSGGIIMFLFVGLRLVDRIPHPVLQFGGVAGQTVTTLVFRRLTPDWVLFLMIRVYFVFWTVMELPSDEGTQKRTKKLLTVFIERGSLQQVGETKGLAMQWAEFHNDPSPTFRVGPTVPTCEYLWSVLATWKCYKFVMAVPDSELLQYVPQRSDFSKSPGEHHSSYYHWLNQIFSLPPQEIASPSRQDAKPEEFPRFHFSRKPSPSEQDSPAPSCGPLNLSMNPRPTSQLSPEQVTSYPFVNGSIEAFRDYCEFIYFEI